MAPSRMLARVRALPAPERHLLASAWLGLALAPVLLSLLPFRMLREWAERGTAPRASAVEPATLRATALVEAAARHHVVATSCLARALVLCRLLRHRGLPAKLVVGVARAGGRLEAHAWVQCDGAALSAGPVERFAPLLGRREFPATTAHGA